MTTQNPRGVHRSATMLADADTTQSDRQGYAVLLEAPVHLGKTFRNQVWLLNVHIWMGNGLFLFKIKLKHFAHRGNAKRKRKMFQVPQLWMKTTICHASIIYIISNHYKNSAKEDITISSLWMKQSWVKNYLDAARSGLELSRLSAGNVHSCLF